MSTTTSTPPTTEPELLTAHEYAAKWRVTPRSVYRWISNGQLVGVRVGNVVRVPDGQLPARTV